MFCSSAGSVPTGTSRLQPLPFRGVGSKNIGLPAVETATGAAGGGGGGGLGAVGLLIALSQLILNSRLGGTLPKLNQRNDNLFQFADQLEAPLRCGPWLSNYKDDVRKLFSVVA